MEVLYVTHPSFLAHETGAWHPERPLRLEAVERGVLSSGLRVRRVQPPEIDRATLELVHDASYIDALNRFCKAGGGALDPDTVASPASWEAALRAAGAGPAAVEALQEAGPETTAFLAVRPPGHHALRNRAMGFCLFNNAAITARYVERRGGRVAIVDWDVHHGNGTQELLGSDPNVCYLSFHQSPFYPFGGHVTETGEDAGLGTIVNVPLPAGTGGDVYRAGFERVALPMLRQFSPDWVLLSAGYDAHEDDPLAEMRLISSDYGYMAGRLTEVVSANRVIVFLEGGYNLAALTDSVAETLRGLAGTTENRPPRVSGEASWKALEAAISAARASWDLDSSG